MSVKGGEAVLVDLPMSRSRQSVRCILDYHDHYYIPKLMMDIFLLKNYMRPIGGNT